MGSGGIPVTTPQDVAAALAGCQHFPYIAVLSKWTQDPQAQRELIGALTGRFTAEYIREGAEHPSGLHVLSRLSAEVTYLQYIDGYKCNHCGGRGIRVLDGKVEDCKNCTDGGGCFSDAFKARYLHVPSIKEYRITLEGVEMELSEWESEGLRYFNARMREDV